MVVCNHHYHHKNSWAIPSLCLPGISDARRSFSSPSVKLSPLYAVFLRSTSLDPFVPFLTGPLGSLLGIFFQGFDASVQIHRYLDESRLEVSIESDRGGACDEGRRASTRSHVRVLHVAKGRSQLWRPHVQTWRCTK